MNMSDFGDINNHVRIDADDIVVYEGATLSIGAGVPVNKTISVRAGGALNVSEGVTINGWLVVDENGILNIAEGVIVTKGIETFNATVNGRPWPLCRKCIVVCTLPCPNVVKRV
jgi:hypothetical protein